MEPLTHILLSPAMFCERLGAGASLHKGGCYNIDWNSDPPPGFESTDRMLLLMVGYHW